MEGEDGNFLLEILLNGEDSHVVGLDEMAIPDSQGTQSRQEGVQVSRSTKGGTRRSKNFHWKEDKVVCSGWLNVSKDP
jgi:hypothetical protein